MHPEELAGVALLGQLAPDALALVAAAARERRWSDGEVIFRRGDPADGIYIVRQGSVRVMMPAAEGPGHLATLGPGSGLGEMSLLGGERERSADAIAEDAVLVFIPLAAIRDLRKQHPPDFAAALLALSRQVVERLDDANGKLVDRLLAER